MADCAMFLPPCCSCFPQVRCATFQPILQDQTCSDGPADPRMRREDRREGGTGFMLGLPVGCGLFFEPAPDGPLSTWHPLLQQAQLTLSFLQS